MAPASRLPSRLGQYRLEGRVRVEGAAEVFLAREEGPHDFARDVTLRIIRRDGDASSFDDSALVREMRFREGLDHPAIGHVHELFVEGDRVVLVVEGRETVTLDEILGRLAARGEHLPDSAAAYVVATVAEALAHAHAQPTPVLHRAISPAAVVIAEDGTVRLSAPPPLQTMRSPEEAGGAAPTARSDVWQLGVLALQVFARGDAASVLARAASLRPPRLAALRRDLPRELCAAIDAALTLDPSARSIGSAELARWIARVIEFDAGRSWFRQEIEPAFEVPHEGSGSQRLTRAIRRQLASRHRLRRARVREPEHEAAPISTDPISVELEELEPVELEELEPVDAPTPPTAEAPMPVVPPRRRVVAGIGSRALLVATALSALAIVAHGARGPGRARVLVPLAQRSQPEPTPPAFGPPAAPVASATMKPPARKPLPEFGWLHVHSGGTIGQVFVAARAWGETEKTIQAPCGRYYVNVARTDRKGIWRGWLNYGRIVDIPCDGTLAEITLSKPL